jgi:antitoxin CptB
MSNPSITQTSSTEISSTETTIEISLADRKVIYRARRGLKELVADVQEKADFSTLIDQEDPDLLDWFMNVTLPPDELVSIINRIKLLKA